MTRRSPQEILKSSVENDRSWNEILHRLEMLKECLCLLPGIALKTDGPNLPSRSSSGVSVVRVFETEGGLI
jgi:hypothetical protein